MQDIELAANSQWVSERLYNLLAVGEGGQCPKRAHDEWCPAPIPPRNQ